jgi:hypothetical protein
MHKEKTMSKFEYGVRGADGAMQLTSYDEANAAGTAGQRRLHIHGRAHPWIALHPQLTPSNVIHYDAMERRIEVGSYALIAWGDFSDLKLCQVIKLTPQKVRVLLVGINTDTLRSPRNLVVVDTELVEG